MPFGEDSNNVLPGKDMGYDVLFPRRSGPRQRVLKRCMADKLDKLKEHDFRWTWLVSESYIFHALGTMVQSQRPRNAAGVNFPLQPVE